MNQDQENDWKLWKGGTSHSTAYNAIWRFSKHHIRICLAAQLHSVSLGAQILKELALFDLTCCFWNAADAISRKEHLEANFVDITRYHKALHNNLTAAILEIDGSDMAPLYRIFLPWLRRTLLFYDHDMESREAFKAVPCPEQFTETVIEEILRKPSFQSYMTALKETIAGADQFSWIGFSPSWTTILIPRSIEADENRCDRYSKGVFILSHEIQEEVWTSFFKMPTFKRVLGTGILDPDALGRLKSQQLLNDELINCYVGLFQGVKADVKVLDSRVFRNWQVHDLEKSLRILKKMLGFLEHEPMPDGLSSLTRIILPVHWNDDHWLVVVLDIETQSVIFMDSLSSYTGKKGRRTIAEIIQNVIPSTKLWSLLERRVPQQVNGYDCGVYASQFIKFAFFDREAPAWDTADIEELRHLMALEIYEGSLRWFHF